MASLYDDAHAGKIVVDDRSSPGLEVVPQFNRNYGYGISASNREIPAASWGQAAQKGQRTLFGLRRTTFILSVVLLLVIIAAAVGGGVGGSMAVAQARERTSTAPQGNITTPTPTSSPTSNPTSLSPAPSSTSDYLPLDCPRINNTVDNISFDERSWDFKITCGTDWASWDLLAIIAYTLHDCMHACASYNRNADRSNRGSERCLAVVFNSYIAWSVPNNYGTCFLKNSTADVVQGSDSRWAGAIITGTIDGL